MHHLVEAGRSWEADDTILLNVYPRKCLLSVGENLEPPGQPEHPRDVPRTLAQQHRRLGAGVLAASSAPTPGKRPPGCPGHRYPRSPHPECQPGRSSEPLAGGRPGLSPAASCPAASAHHSGISSMCCDTRCSPQYRCNIYQVENTAHKGLCLTQFYEYLAMC